MRRAGTGTLLLAFACLWLLACGGYGDALKKSQQAAKRIESTNELRQIAIVASYDPLTGDDAFPADSYDASGKPLLSWRVHLLPALGQEALYRQFHLNEPWNSPHNTTLIAMRPAIYASPSLSKKVTDKTAFLALVHKDGIFTGEPHKKIRRSDVQDGLTNTLLLVEADEDQAVVWTQPKDIRFDPAKPLAGIGHAYDDKFVVVMADGSIKQLGANVSPEGIKAAVTRSGGEPGGL